MLHLLMPMYVIEICLVPLEGYGRVVVIVVVVVAVGICCLGVGLMEILVMVQYVLVDDVMIKFLM